MFVQKFEAFSVLPNLWLITSSNPSNFLITLCLFCMDIYFSGVDVLDHGIMSGTKKMTDLDLIAVCSEDGSHVKFHQNAQIWLPKFWLNFLHNSWAIGYVSWRVGIVLMRRCVPHQNLSYLVEYLCSYKRWPLGVLVQTFGSMMASMDNVNT